MTSLLPIFCATKLFIMIIRYYKYFRMVSVAPVGIVAMVMLLICSCTFLYRVPKLRPFMFQTKSGALGLFYKCAVIGTRLSREVAFATGLTALIVLFV